MTSGTPCMPAEWTSFGDAGQCPSAVSGDRFMTRPRRGPADRARAPGGGAGRVVRTLKDGYWDRTEVVQLGDGSLRVRKSSKGDAPPGPWGVAALRKEIEYLSTLPDRARAVFPPVLAAWDDAAAEPPRVGYEVPFYAEHIDAGELARKGALAQSGDRPLSGALAEALLERVRAGAGTGAQPLSRTWFPWSSMRCARWRQSPSSRG